MKRVLILIPTNGIKAYCIGKFLTNLKSLDLADADILFSDDSRDEEHATILQRAGYEVTKVKKTIDKFKAGEQVPIIQCLANARNHLRNEFIKREQYTHALWLDSDVLPPTYVVRKLLDHDKDLVSGIYFQKRGGIAGKEHYEYLAPMLFKYKEKECVKLGIREYADEISVQELFPNRLIGGNDSDMPLAALGTGCFMASRKVMADDRWTFRYNPDRPDTTEDMWFSMDLAELGYELFADTNVVCRHLMLEWNGKTR